MGKIWVAGHFGFAKRPETVIASGAKQSLAVGLEIASAIKPPRNGTLS